MSRNTPAARRAAQLERDAMRTVAGLVSVGDVVSVRLSDSKGVMRRHVGTVVKTNVRCDRTWDGIVIQFADGERSLVMSVDVTVKQQAK